MDHTGNEDPTTRGAWIHEKNIVNNMTSQGSGCRALRVPRLHIVEDLVIQVKAVSKGFGKFGDREDYPIVDGYIPAKWSVFENGLNQSHSSLRNTTFKENTHHALKGLSPSEGTKAPQIWCWNVPLYSSSSRS
jgi:hypothetical protein